MGEAHAPTPAWRRGLHGVYVIAKKDARLYYFRPPVLIHGMLMPAFFFLVFVVARRASAVMAIPGIIAMTLCFAASAVAPMITPWERRSKTYERLISSPISTFSIILGDVVAGACFGFVLACVALAFGLAFTDVRVVHPGMLAGALVLSSLCFGSLGVLLSSPPTNNPSQIMMLSNVVRMPLIFISGVLAPLAEMPGWGRALAPVSPLSYCGDMMRVAFGGSPYFPLWLDVLAVVAFTVVFLLAARFFHRRGRSKGLP